MMPTAASASKTLARGAARGVQRTVFLVDDNPQFRSSAQWWLSGAGYEVRDFGDPQSALDELRRMAEEDPQSLRHACLLLDVRMPGMSGLDLHDQLCDSGITLRAEADALVSAVRPALPVVYMTGHGDVPLAVSAMQKGAVTMLEKPFADNALEAALERAFASAESAWARAQMHASTGDVAQPRRLQVSTDGQTVGEAMQPQHADAMAANLADTGARHLFSEAGMSPAVAPGRAEYQRRVASLSPRQREVFNGIVAGKLSKQIAYDCGLSAKTVEFHRKAVMVKLQARNAMDLLRMAVSGSVEAADVVA
jgi:two-component system, LuxR family, response regulator FixJ